MGITRSSYALTPQTIPCNGEVEGIVSLTASPDVFSNPVDVVLVLDRSGSMLGAPFEALKAASKKFIEILGENTAGDAGQIGNGSRVGIVSFAATATQDTPFLTSVETLEQTIDDLTIRGGTNHEDAFTKAVELFDCCATGEKILIIFTDGQSTAGGSAIPITSAAKAQDITIYGVLLDGLNGMDILTAAQWVTPPAASFLSVTPNPQDLEQLFADLAQNITKPGATNLQIDGTLTPEFTLMEVFPPDKGEAERIDETQFQWRMEELGNKQTEGASLRLKLRHIGSSGGNKETLTTLDYADNENNVAIFPRPTVDVNCTQDVHISPCPPTVSLTIEGCDEPITYDLGEFSLLHTGRIVELSLILRNICPNHRTALAVILTEKDKNKNRIPRGFQAVTVPAHHAPTCRDIRIKGLRFVLPDDEMTTACQQRQLFVQVVAHDVDSGFSCTLLP